MKRPASYGTSALETVTVLTEGDVIYRPIYTLSSVNKRLLRFRLCLFEDERVHTQAFVAFTVRVSCQRRFLGFGGRIDLIDQIQIGPPNPEGWF